MTQEKVAHDCATLSALTAATSSSGGPRRGQSRQRTGKVQGRGNSPPDGRPGPSPGLLEGRRVASECPPGRHRRRLGPQATLRRRQGGARRLHGHREGPWQPQSAAGFRSWHGLHCLPRKVTSHAAFDRPSAFLPCGCAERHKAPGCPTCKGDWPSTERAAHASPARSAPRACSTTLLTPLKARQAPDCKGGKTRLKGG